jgi:hypothetical protein
VSAYLSASAGKWDNSPTSFKYQWYANGSPLKSRTTPTLLLGPAEQGDTIAVTVTATNATGSASQSSRPTATIAATPWRNVTFPHGLAANQLACPSATTCFALATDTYQTAEYLVTFSGDKWGKPMRLARANTGDLACAPDGFCMLVAGNQFIRTGWTYRTYDHGKWSSPHPMPRLPTNRNGGPWYGGYFQLSCWSVNLCSAVMGGVGKCVAPGNCSSGGWLVLYSAALHELKAPADPTFMPFNKGMSHWTAPIQATSKHHLWMAACTSATSCIVMDDLDATASFFNGRSWSHQVPLNLGWVGCSTPSFCIAMDYWYFAGERFWNGHKWSPYLNWSLGDAACHGALGCFAYRLGGGELKGGMYLYGAMVHLSKAGLTQTEAVGVTSVNDQYNGGTSSQSGVPFAYVDCPAANFCLIAGGGPAGGGEGYSFVYRSAYGY